MADREYEYIVDKTRVPHMETRGVTQTITLVKYRSTNYYIHSPWGWQSMRVEADLSNEQIEKMLAIATDGCKIVPQRPN